MSGDFDVMTPEQFVAAGGDDKGSRSYNWKDAVLQNGFLQIMICLSQNLLKILIHESL
jgi:hypothetical protein